MASDIMCRTLPAQQNSLPGRPLRPPRRWSLSGHGPSQSAPGRDCRARALRTLLLPPALFWQPRDPLTPSTRTAFPAPNHCQHCPLTKKVFFLLISSERLPIKTRTTGFSWKFGSLGNKPPARQLTTGTGERLFPLAGT